MRGSIRVFVGLVVMMGIAGGIDTATDGQLLVLIAMAIATAGVMLSGVRAMNRV